MKLNRIFFATALSCVCMSAVFADNTVIKEETTPPGNAGPLTLDQIQPYVLPPAPKPAPVAPSASPAAAPAATAPATPGTTTTTTQTTTTTTK